MSVFVPNSRHLREVLIFCFHLERTAAEAHRMVFNTYGESVPSERTCREWFQRFNSGNFDIEDQPGAGRAKNFQNSELEELLDVYSCQTQEKLASSLGVTQQTISKHLQEMGMVQK